MKFKLPESFRICNSCNNCIYLEHVNLQNIGEIEVCIEHNIGWIMGDPEYLDGICDKWECEL